MAAREQEQRKTLKRWLHAWAEPDYEFTPLEILAYDAALRLERKTIKEWGLDLSIIQRDETDPGDSRPLTRDEAALMGIMTSRDHDRLIQRCTEQLVGLLKKFDTFMALVNPNFPKDEAQLNVANRIVRGELAPPPWYVLYPPEPVEDDRDALEAPKS